MGAMQCTVKDSVNLLPIAIDCNRVFTCFESPLLASELTRQFVRDSARQNCPQRCQFYSRDITTDPRQLLASCNLLTCLDKADPVMQTHFMFTPEPTQFNRLGIGSMCGRPVLA